MSDSHTNPFNDLPLPPYADRLSDGTYLEVGAILPTRDGRRIGNSIVILVEQRHLRIGSELETVARIKTDAGNKTTMTELELMEMFYPPYLISKSTFAIQGADVSADRFSVSLNPAPFQYRVEPWMMFCFGKEIASDTKERNHRFLEESLELVQACGCTSSESHQLVDYVFNRPVGKKHQEIGGVMVTLAALCLAQNLDMHESGEIELDRIWGKQEEIRKKQANKPKRSPLPQAEQITRNNQSNRHAEFATRLISGRDYLMNISAADLTVKDALESIGFKLGDSRL